MNKFHKSYRIRTNIGKDTHLHVKLDSDYDVLELMSLQINQENAYKLHTSNYGVIAGRVLANESFGVPNAKVSVFINIDENDINDTIKTVLYPYNTTNSKNKDGIRYNLLTNEQISNCHTTIGTFPEKQYLLDNDSVLEVFEKYYKYTTRTNNSGDYMIFGIPVGSQTIHVDIDLSDIGILSQKPRDMVYKGYNIEQFENPNKFKQDTNLDSLVQVITQNTIADVIPFWGDDTNTSIGITRCDINVQYKFEPTCIFMGSVVSDTASNGISKKCIPTPGMGSMEELTTGSGTIEMIRKTPSGDVEEFQIKGNQLINGDGVWCYQIPMNLDYIMTDEYGNTVPTDNPEKGIPTRTKVRFRMSLQDFDSDNSNMHRCKMLVPHNPDVYSDNCVDDIDYQFGTKTKDDSFKDLFWNGIYSVKSYIPRIQKGSNWKNEKFTGFKRVNFYGDKNPLPYNNIRIRIPLMYTLMCLIFKMIIRTVGLLNRLFKIVARSFANEKNEEGEITSGSFLTLSGEMCDDNLDYLCIIPGINIKKIASKNNKRTTILGMTFLRHYFDVTGNNGKLGDGGVTISSFDSEDESFNDNKSIDVENSDGLGSVSDKTGMNKTYYYNPSDKNEKNLKVYLYGVRVTDKVDYLVQCIEMNLAQEYKVIQFDFYNDWINGVIYIPRWMRNISKKRTFLWGAIKVGGKVKACNENYAKNRNIVQQCGLTYNLKNNNFIVDNNLGVGCTGSKKGKLRCHKSAKVRKAYSIFGTERGIVKSIETLQKQYVYYFKPCELGDKNVRLFATDIILLGTLNECDMWGIPNNLTDLYSSTYQLPPNLALTDSDIEGSLYESDINKDQCIYFKLNNKKETITEIDLGNCYVGLNVMNEGGNYTEISGIDWGYTGPLQEGKNSTKFYKPGGHFLGLTCRNSETSIKTCVNLSRICEHGVWMSQRKELSIPDKKDGKFLEYATVPSGLISKDEISDTDYRRLFASMNKNKLKTIISDETGYPVYDFEYVNPTNFNGELSENVKSEESMNRKVTSFVTEKNYNYTDDDYYLREENGTEKVNEIQIIRTGEYKDDEYFKFRFGLTDENINNNSAKSKRFLLYSNNSGSMPVYDNSFYFYFGLHDGKTALDEFKKNYYANCEKMKSLSQRESSITISNVKTTYDGVATGRTYTSLGSGTLSFKVVANNEFFENGLFITLKDEDGKVIRNRSKINTNGEVSYNKLHGGNYTVVIDSDNDLNINEVFYFTIKMINITASVENVNFILDVNGKGITEVFKYDRKKYKGYIKINNNNLSYNNDNNVSDIYIFDDYVKSITIKGSDNNVISNSNNQNNKTLFILNNSNGVNLTQEEETGNYIIPVHKCDISYTLEIETYIDSNGKLTNNSRASIGTHTWVFDGIVVENAIQFDILFNGLSYQNSLKTIIDNNVGTVDSYNGWWALNNNGGLSLNGDRPEYYWQLKKALYLNSLEMPHSLSISPLGGNSPFSEQITCMRESTVDDEAPNGYLHDTAIYDTYDKNSIIGNITIPTINFISGATNTISDLKRRTNFKYKVTDVNGQVVPQDYDLIFPIIYKPFFMEMGLWYFDQNEKFYLYGNVYNGVTWDYANEGFNYVLLNDLIIINAIGPLKNDDTYMEFNEPTIKSEYRINNSGGYNFTGVTYDNKMLPYFKYNGRKTLVNREILPITYGLYTGKITPNINITIGCEHVFEGRTYSDKTICESDPNSGVTFISYQTDSYPTGYDYYIKMEPKHQIPTGVLIKNYIIDNDNYELPDIPNTQILNVSDKLYRHIMNDTIIDSKIKNKLTSSGYIKIDDTLKNKKICYLSIIDAGGSYNIKKENTTSTNENNKIKAISISNIVDLGYYTKFYPMGLTMRIEDIWDENKEEYDSKLIINGYTSAFFNKKFIFKFYYKPNDRKLFDLLTLELKSSASELVIYELSETERFHLRLNGIGSESFGKSTDFLTAEFDVYDGSYKSPTTFTYQNENGGDKISIKHVDKFDV